MNQNIVDISLILEKYFVDMNKSEYSIFLCGGASSKDALFRKMLYQEIIKKKSKYQYKAYTPEVLFLEFIMGYKKYDSLSLENILAKSVNSIVIPLQSPGTFTELGAFSNHSELQNKLIIIINPKFKNDKSFINSGPIAFLKKNTQSIITYSNCDLTDVVPLTKEIIDNTRHISKNHEIDYTLKNPLSSFGFYLALIFVFEPISKQKIEEIIKIIDSSNEAMIVCETVLNSLISQRKVHMNINEEYYILKSAISDLYSLYSTAKFKTEVIDFLTSLRLKALNIMLRKKSYKIWREDQAIRQPFGAR